ncbi:MAG: TraR/DksA C4-type zinc finger protein [Candidatus Sericytochromatia bacterium]|nr:TraR/DksA C4-type zinc finger protein [Candidatus Sericytochromatia bacterium]
MAKSMKEHRQALLGLRQRYSRLAGDYQTDVEDNANADQGINDSSPGNSDNEIADAATGTYMQEFALTMRMRYRDRVTAVDEALTRVDQGTYGRCAVCDKPISETRLDLMPETPYCALHAATAQAIDAPTDVTRRSWPGPSTAA